MANIAVVFSLLIVALNAFQFVNKYGLASRSFYSIGPHLVETAVLIPGFDSEALVPSFDHPRLKEAVIVYLSELLFPELDEFTLSFYYYDPHNSMVCASVCQGVTIELCGS